MPLVAGAIRLGDLFQKRKVRSVGFFYTCAVKKGFSKPFARHVAPGQRVGAWVVDASNAWCSSPICGIHGLQQCDDAEACLLNRYFEAIAAPVLEERWPR